MQVHSTTTLPLTPLVRPLLDGEINHDRERFVRQRDVVFGGERAGRPAASSWATVSSRWAYGGAFPADFRLYPFRGLVFPQALSAQRLVPFHVCAEWQTLKLAVAKDLRRAAGIRSPTLRVGSSLGSRLGESGYG